MMTTEWSRRKAFVLTTFFVIRRWASKARAGYFFLDSYSGISRSKQYSWKKKSKVWGIDSHLAVVVFVKSHRPVVSFYYKSLLHDRLADNGRKLRAPYWANSKWRQYISETKNGSRAAFSYEIISWTHFLLFTNISFGAAAERNKAKIYFGSFLD